MILNGLALVIEVRPCAAAVKTSSQKILEEQGKKYISLFDFPCRPC